ncbi:uncharacterized protein LOC143476701 isoform X2 [Brachyhypopomus gauderio]|uniref:uncharacterized protein LOC143476701 isoform X2 n=1 Tax=Brachyhypopomus gauderio TaxID=698409 RepID=UPI0040421660
MTMKKSLLERSSEKEEKRKEIREGDSFESYENFQRALRVWCAEGNHPMHKERSEKIHDTDSVLTETIQYSRLTLSCVHYGFKRTCKSKHERPFQHYLRMGCPVIMKIRYDRKLCKLIVCKLVEEHNHPVSAQIFQKYPQNRRPTEEERQEIERLVQLKVIHAYLGLLAEESIKPVYILQCFLEGFWKKNQYDVWKYQNVQFETYQWIFLPICRNSHWFLVAANVELRKVYVMDSQPSVIRQRQWLNHWRNFMRERAITGEKLDGWTSGSIPTVTQEDGSSCGVFALMNAEALLRFGDPASMKQSQVNEIRLYIRDRIIAAGTNKE